MFLHAHDDLDEDGGHDDGEPKELIKERGGETDRKRGREETEKEGERETERESRQKSGNGRGGRGYKTQIEYMSMCDDISVPDHDN